MAANPWQFPYVGVDFQDRWSRERAVRRSQGIADDNPKRKADALRTKIHLHCERPKVEASTPYGHGRDFSVFGTLAMRGAGDMTVECHEFFIERASITIISGVRYCRVVRATH